MKKQERVEALNSLLDYLAKGPTPPVMVFETIINILIDMNSTKKETFKPPTPEEVADYGKEIGYRINGESFCCSYAQKGWMVGKTKMTDWRCAVRNWKANKWGEVPMTDKEKAMERTPVKTTAKEVADLLGDYYEESRD